MGDETAVAAMSPDDVAVAMKAAEILSPENSQMYALARVLAKSDIIPKDMQKKPSNVFLILMKAQLLGVSPAEALENVMVVNGRSAVWGDLFLALIQRAPQYEWHKEYYTGTFPNDDYTAICEMKRRGIEEPFRGEFSIADAKTAKLWGGNVWAKYPKDMLKYRARTRCGRGGFADALKGVTTVEEARDIPRHIDVEVVDTKPGTGMAAAAALLKPSEKTQPDVTPKPEDRGSRQQGRKPAVAQASPATREGGQPLPANTVAPQPGESRATISPGAKPPSAEEMRRAELIDVLTENCESNGYGVPVDLDQYTVDQLTTIAHNAQEADFDPLKPLGLDRGPQRDESSEGLFDN